MNIEIRHLRCFIAVAEELHFNHAAQRLSIAQPALSRTIQQLEDRLEMSLLTRTSRRVQLTDAGKVYLEGCYATLACLERSATQARKSILGEIGHLILGYTDFAINGEMPHIIDKFRMSYPEITLDIRHGFTEDQLVDLKQNVIDFGFLTGPVRASNLCHHPVQINHFVAVFSENHHLAKKEEIFLSDFIDQPFIIGNTKGWRHFRLHLDALCLNAGFEPLMVQEAYNTDGILGMIAANMGVTIHLDCINNYYRKGVVIKPIKDVTRQICTEATWTREKITPAKQIFIDFLHRYTSASVDSSITDTVLN